MSCSKSLSAEVAAPVYAEKSAPSLASAPKGMMMMSPVIGSSPKRRSPKTVPRRLFSFLASAVLLASMSAGVVELGGLSVAQPCGSALVAGLQLKRAQNRKTVDERIDEVKLSLQFNQLGDLAQQFEDLANEAKQSLGHHDDVDWLCPLESDLEGFLLESDSELTDSVSGVSIPSLHSGSCILYLLVIHKRQQPTGRL